MLHTRTVEWSTKNLAMVTAATSQIGKQGFRQISRTIQQMTLTPTDPRKGAGEVAVDVNEMTEEQLRELVEGDIKLTPEQLKRNSQFRGI